MVGIEIWFPPKFFGNNILPFHHQILVAKYHFLLPNMFWQHKSWREAKIFSANVICYQIQFGSQKKLFVTKFWKQNICFCYQCLVAQYNFLLPITFRQQKHRRESKIFPTDGICYQINFGNKKILFLTTKILIANTPSHLVLRYPGYSLMLPIVMASRNQQVSRRNSFLSHLLPSRTSICWRSQVLPKQYPVPRI